MTWKQARNIARTAIFVDKYHNIFGCLGDKSIKHISNLLYYCPDEIYDIVDSELQECIINDDENMEIYRENLYSICYLIDHPKFAD